MKTNKPRLGAVPVSATHTRFEVWAPKRKRVEVVVEGSGAAYPLEPHAKGYYVGLAPLQPGTRYRYRLDGKELFNDPCSRYQPEGAHGPSEIVDPSGFEWSDQAWPGVGHHGHVIYELHVGAFTPEGTWAALQQHLPYFKSLGVTLIEVMPIHAFPGEFNWGYDGVHLFAPSRTYGQPDDVRRFVDAAHAQGLGVILDVVYNHLGPDGNYLQQYADDYFSDRYPKEWGDPPNFDGPNAEGMRRFVCENAAAWIDEYHFDGLRLDATQNLFDTSEVHITADISRSARAAAGKRSIYVVGESERQDAKLVQPLKQGGSGLDSLWVDDFCHCAIVAASGAAEAYRQDFAGSAQELLACALRNGIYQNQHYAWQNQQRGTNLRAVEPSQVVFCLQNHDQVANSLNGSRLHQYSCESHTRALTTFWLLLPQTPMLFMGQEFFATTPFLYFVDHHEKLQRDVDRGRATFIEQFASAKQALASGGTLPRAHDALQLSRLNLSEREKHHKTLEFHRELIRLRQSSSLFTRPGKGTLEGAVIDEVSLVLRWNGSEGEPDRLLVMSLGVDRFLTRCSEPLLAPNVGKQWALRFSSEDAKWGGRGVRVNDGRGPWFLQGRCATLLEEVPAEAKPPEANRP